MEFAFLYPGADHPDEDHLTERLVAFRDGISQHGHTATNYVGLGPAVKPADVVVVNSGYFPGYPEENHPLTIAKRLWRVTGTPYINLGNGVYHKHGLATVAWNGGIKYEGVMCNDGSPMDRMIAHGLVVKPWRVGTDTGHILLAGQVPDDPSVRDTDHRLWLKVMAEAIHDTVPGRKIIFRPHPLAAGLIVSPKDATLSTNERLVDDLVNCHAVVCYNSASSAMVVLDGIPVITFDPASPAWAVSEHDIANIASPHLTPHRQQWANDLAYSQWYKDEMASGEVWERLAPYGLRELLKGPA